MTTDVTCYTSRMKFEPDNQEIQDNNNFLPIFPTFSNELVEQCKQSQDFRPILFEWYKFVGIFCSTISCISSDSLAVQKIPPAHYGVLIGLLNRCSRLMLANIRLSSTRKYGETTRLIDRSISESAIKIQWFCKRNDTDSFIRYLADGLKKDLILKEQITENVQNRDNKILVIEQRMLDSIQNCINLSDLSEQDINDAKKLPDFASMCNTLEFGNILYTVIQRMGSHAVHGTWSELIFNYLEHEGNRFHPRDHDVDTEDAQYIVVIQLVLDAIESFLGYVIVDLSEISDIIETINQVHEKITAIQHLAWSSDFNNID